MECTNYGNSKIFGGLPGDHADDAKEVRLYPPIDVAEHLGVTKPSVSYATKRLRESGYITMDKTGLITLEPKGLAIAREMLDRHHTLTNFLVRLGVDQETAEADACKIEHDISPQTFAAICRHAREHQG